MANWWDAAPLAESQPQAGNWWDAAPLADAMPQAAGGVPMVPLYAPDGAGGEVNVNANPQIRAQFDAMVAQQDAAKAQEQAAFDATRTPLTRVQDAATFAASMIPRTLTKGEYGIGDVVGMASPEMGQALSQNEADFARANEEGLEVAKAAGDVMAGVPMLSTMGAVPGQVSQSGFAAARALPGEVRRLLGNEAGSAKLPGGPMPGAGGVGSPPPATPPAAPAAPMPSPRDELLAAGQRQGVTVPRMVAGSETQKDMAAGLAGMPYVGAPVKMAYDKALDQLAAARDTAGKTLGTPGVEQAGTGAKQGVLDWVRQTSKDALKSRYDEVYDGLDQQVTRPLNDTAKAVARLQQEMQASTSQASAPALKLLEEAMSRPEGLSAKGLAELRSEIGRRIEASKVVPDAGEAAYKRLYPALTNDLKETIKAAGGDKALSAWNRANREASVVAAKRKRLAQIVGSRDDAISEEKVLERINALANAKGGNMRNLKLAKEVVGQKAWGNVGAELVNRLGTNPQDGAFSAQRFLTGYGKMSEAGKAELFGPAKSALDDIALLSQKFHDLDKRFNKSNTGKVTTMLKIITNPGVGAANAATALVSPVGMAMGAAQLAGFQGGRSLAWHLASPATAKRASNMVRAFYNAERVAAKVGKAVAKNEQALSASVRAYAQELARQSGDDAAGIEASIMEQIKQARQSPES